VLVAPDGAVARREEATGFGQIHVTRDGFITLGERKVRYRNGAFEEADLWLDWVSNTYGSKLSRGQTIWVDDSQRIWTWNERYGLRRGPGDEAPMVLHDAQGSLSQRG